MSNRENLRRIAALSLVIAFGMSGAAGLADATNEVTNIAEEGEEKKDEALTVSFENVDFTLVATSDVPNTYRYTGKKLKVVDNTAATYDLSVGWSFKRGGSEIWDYAVKSTSENCKVSVSSTTCYTLNFKEAGEYYITIKAIDDEEPCEDAFITLIFDVVAEQTPPAPVEKTATLVVDENTGDFKNADDDTTENVYEYNPADGLAFDENDECKVEFDKFWKFVLSSGTDNNEVGDTAGAVNGKVSFTLKKSADNNTFKVKVCAKEGDNIYESENNDVLTLVFNVKNYVPEEPVKPEFKIEYNDSSDEFELVEDEDAVTYDLWRYSKPIRLTDEPATISFNKFWQFTLNNKELGFDISADDDGCKIVPVPAEGKNTNDPDYEITFSKPGTHTFTVSVAKDDYGYKAVKVQFVVGSILTPMLRPGSDFALTEDKSFQFKGDFVEVDEESGCKYTATFKPFWNYYLNDDTVDTAIFDSEGKKVDAVADADGNITLSFAPGATYNYTVKALKDVANSIAYETAEVVPLVFVVPEHTEIKNAELVIDGDKLGNFKAVEAAYAYPELTLSENGSCTVECERFWSFKVKGTDDVITIEDIEDNGNIDIKRDGDKYTFTFDKASGENPFEVKIYAQKDDGTLYNDEDDDFLTLNFTVKPAPEKTTEPDYPYYPPVDPVTPAPTATPTATPAPTETPAPTDAPTDAPTSEPTATPDVEMQVSAGGKRLNVRSGAGIGNNIIARLNDGSKVTVLLVEGDWSYIRATVNGNVVEGYVSSQYLKEISTVEPTEPTNARVSTSGSALRLRASASLNAPIITRMPNGSSLKVLETVNGWCRVQFTAANGTVHEGWASSQYITVIA